MNLTAFQYSDKEVRTIVIDNEPWFVAKDLCDILGIVNVSQAMSRLDADEKGICSNDTPGGKQDLAMVSESGMYALVLRSRKPEAQPFRKWITSEVVPSIRKTGGYAIAPNVEPEPVALPVRDTVEYIEAADKLERMSDSILKLLLKDCLIDELELRHNNLALPSGDRRKQYTIVKVRAMQLGYSAKEIGKGTDLGRFVKARIKPSHQELVGRFPVYHYEVNSDLDTAIHTFFGAAE